MDNTKTPKTVENKTGKTDDKLFYDAIVGLVVGDAVGVPFECGWRDEFNVTDMVGYEHGMPGYHKELIPIGTWSDDSALTFATIDSFHHLKKWDSFDLLDRFCKWFYEDKYIPVGQKRFGEGKITVRAFEAFKSGTPADECGVRDETALGNGSLMRILPLAFYPHTTDDIKRVSALTHASSTCITGCLLYIKTVENLIGGMTKQEAVKNVDWGKHEQFSRIENITDLSRDEIKSSGHVVETLEAAIWCFLTTDNYRDCILKAVNLGRDTDTVAAVAGGLAGLYYDGDNGIPKQWIDNLQPGYEKYVVK